ncbi:klarsicht isoform X2 [Lycorma delicatula]|uniref:klarsicht isoform X2 n=1 Tax=Lycorma delicatula TaxID=130591 RepID=UPI003F51536E
METNPGRPRYYFSPHVHPARRRYHRQSRLVSEHSSRHRWSRRSRGRWRIPSSPYSSQTSSSTGASSGSEDEACPRLLTQLFNCYSDTETAMPGGFENSAMKSSFSLSSLQPSSVNLESPEHATLKDRPYNSLRKKYRKDSEVDMWRRSWGSHEENKDEFWAALKNNYQYLMDNNLIESCREAGNDLQGVSGASPTHEWSFEQFKHQFVELDAWLTSIHDAFYKNEDNLIDRNLRLNHMEEMLRKSYKRKVFNNQGGRIVARFPELKEEVARRVVYLNMKWERLEQTVTPRKRMHSDRLDVCIDVEHELRCFRRWVKQTDRRLASIDFQTKWTPFLLTEKAKEHEVLQRDVESHGKIVRKLVKVCERITWADSQVEGASVTSFVRGRRLEASQAVRFARSLERRWQLLYLRSLEWLCHIEKLASRIHNSSPQNGKLQESDEEPVSKHPRLSDQQTPIQLQQTQHPDDIHREEVSLMECSLDEAKMIGSQMDNEQPKQINSDINILEPLTAPLKCSSGDNINEKMKTDSVRLRRQSVPIEASHKLFRDDSSEFTQSERRGPHCAIIYYKHKDTDSEQDLGPVSDKMGKKSAEESSEEEWTFNCPDNNTSEQDIGIQTVNNGSSSEAGTATNTIESHLQQEFKTSRTTKNEEIQRLINGAVELVREENNSPRKIPSRLFVEPLRLNDQISKGKFKRVKEWLKVQDRETDDVKVDLSSQTIVDSCDASCECTTEDDDLERHSSDDLNTSSVATCHLSAEAIESGDLDATLVPEKSFPSQILPNSPEHTKVVMRQKRKEGPQIRPRSVSGIPQLAATSTTRLSNFSISESALHQLEQNSSSQCSKMESSVQGTLSSSTVEETTIQAQEGSGGGYSSNSLRRRKVKPRKRNLGRKSESGSDGVLAMESGSPLKSGQRRPPTSGTETEEEAEEGSKTRAVRRKLMTLPAFRLGPGLGAVTVFKPEKAVSADSSFSEQAWDNYQEKYMSEAYSEEAPDPEAARRLLEFGDDYRNYIDSLSDGASSFGRPLHRRRQPTTGDSSVLDSDSDLEDVRNLIHQSHSEYVFSEQVFTRQLSKASPQLILASDFADIIARCRKNVHCLRVLLENIGEADSLLSGQEYQDIQLLIERWETLEGRAENLQRMRTLQREMCAFKEELITLSDRVSALKQDLDDQDQLETRIQQIKVLLGVLRERKAQLLQVNVAVHRFLTDTGHPATTMKDDVADLYRIWEETNQRANAQLSSLQQLSAAWQQFELHLSELQVALRGDHETLRMLDSALQRGSVSPDVATSVRDVAKVLSEKQEMRCESALVLNQCTSILVTTQGVSTTEGSGSLSDSGISDSGSEQELSEREKRLAALRRLARHLEAILAPGSQAIKDMATRIEQTELELRGLQQTCRELIVRTAVCAEAKVGRKVSPSDIPPHCNALPTSRQRTLSSSSRKKNNNSIRKDFLGIGDPDDPDPDKPHSWLWRVMRAALPFQMAIMALFCVACLLEPNCCDNINNLSFSLSPQLRYFDGPPPV